MRGHRQKKNNNFNKYRSWDTWPLLAESQTLAGWWHLEIKDIFKIRKGFITLYSRRRLVKINNQIKFSFIFSSLVLSFSHMALMRFSAVNSENIVTSNRKTMWRNDFTITRHDIAFLKRQMFPKWLVIYTKTPRLILLILRFSHALH